MGFSYQLAQQKVKKPSEKYFQKAKNGNINQKKVEQLEKKLICIYKHTLQLISTNFSFINPKSSYNFLISFADTWTEILAFDDSM